MAVATENVALHEFIYDSTSSPSTAYCFVKIEIFLGRIAMVKVDTRWVILRAARAHQPFA